MTDQPLNLGAIEARTNSATPAPWEPKPHQHGAAGCRCLSCNEDPTGWYVDNSGTTFCDDAVAKLSAAGKTNEFGRELDSCDEGPFLTYADAEFAAHARSDVPALVAEVRRLTAELATMTAVAESNKRYVQSMYQDMRQAQQQTAEGIAKRIEQTAVTVDGGTYPMQTARAADEALAHAAQIARDYPAALSGA